MTERDQTLEEARIGALYRRSAIEEPSAAVDHAVLAAARGGLLRRRYRSPLAWAVAASLVLGIGIGWQVLQIGQVSPLPASAPTGEALFETPAGATLPAPAAEPSESAAGVSSSMATDPAQREAMPANKAPLEAARTLPFSSTEPAAKRPAETRECDAYGLAQDAPLQGWLDAIETARQADDTAQVRCLEQLLRKREESAAEPVGIPQSESER